MTTLLRSRVAPQRVTRSRRTPAYPLRTRWFAAMTGIALGSLLSCLTSATPFMSLYDIVAQPPVEITFPPNEYLLQTTDLQIEIAMRTELLDVPLRDPTLCISVQTVFAPEDVTLYERTSELEKTCFDQQGNYTTFYVTGLVPGLWYAINAALSNRGAMVAHSMRTFQVASLIAPGAGNVGVRVSIATAMSMAAQYHERDERMMAMAIYRAVLDRFPGHVHATHLLGLALYQQGDVDSALPLIQHALERNASDENFHNSMGLCLKKLGRVKEAIHHFRTALELRPSCIEAALNLGDLWQGLGKWEEAMHEFRKVVATLHDEHFVIAQHANHERVVKDALGRLCELLRVTDGWYDAERCLTEAITRWPEDAGFHNDRGHLLLQAGQFEAALSEYERAAELGSLAGRINVADILEALGENQLSSAHYEAIFQDRSITSLALLSRIMIMNTTVLPRILPGSQREIDAVRDRMDAQLTTILTSFGDLTEPIEIDPARIAFSTAITMNAHNRNNRELKRKLGQVYHGLFIERALIRDEYVASYGIFPIPYRQTQKISVATTDRPRRLRVGFISRFFFNPAVGLFMNELLPLFDTSKYELFAFGVGLSKSMKVVEQVAQIAEHIIALPRDLRIARREIQAADLDLIVYPELGMDKTTYFLAFHRLAPVQAVWWGNPDTTGVPAIDYYLVSEHEHENHASHYSERLYQMKGMGVYHKLPERPDANVTRDQIRAVIQERFNLPSDFHFYLTVESTLHMHPDFDEAINRIIQRDPLAYVFLLGSSNRKRWKTQLLTRIETRLGPDLAGRVAFFNDVDGKQEIALLGAADAVLGSIHLTRPKAAMQAFTAGVPVVTLPGELWSSRITHGFYQQMGISGLSATTIDEYVDLAIRLATDESFRGKMSRKVQRRRERLSADDRAVGEWEKFFDLVAHDVLPSSCSVDPDETSRSTNSVCASKLEPE